MSARTGSTVVFVCISLPSRRGYVSRAFGVVLMWSQTAHMVAGIALASTYATLLLKSTVVPDERRKFGSDLAIELAIDVLLHKELDTR